MVNMNDLILFIFVVFHVSLRIRWLWYGLSGDVWLGALMYHWLHEMVQPFSLQYTKIRHSLEYLDCIRFHRYEKSFCYLVVRFWNHFAYCSCDFLPHIVQAAYCIFYCCLPSPWKWNMEGVWGIMLSVYFHSHWVYTSPVFCSFIL